MRRLIATAVALAFWTSAAVAQPGISYAPIGSGAYGYATYAIQATPAGAVYLSGRFPGSEFDALARLNASETPTYLPPGPAGTISEMAIGADGSLYATGWGGPYVGRWSGTEWSQLPNVSPYECSSCIRDLAAAPDGSLYIAGRFYAGVSQQNGVWRFDGTEWTLLGGGMDRGIEEITVGTDGTLYAAGLFTTAGGAAASYVARWDGAAWAPLGTGTDGPVQALAVGLDGSLYAAGEFVTAGAVAARHVARWDGTAWHALSSGVAGSSDAPVEALAIASDGSLIVAGAISEAGGVAVNNVARWDGTAWSALGQGLDGRVFDLAALPDGGLISSSAQFGYARWNGSTWSPPRPDTDAPVRALAVADGTVYAGGEFSRAAGVPANHIAQWSPSQSWRSLGSGVDAPVLAVTSESGTAVYAGGAFGMAGGSPAAHVARWNGTAWSALGTGTDAPIEALALTIDGLLHAGGAFTTAGGSPANHVAQWDGTAWAPLGTGLDGLVHALATLPNGVLYAGGDFMTAGGVPANHVARWDGTAWTQVGSGLDGPVYALLLAPDGTLFAGGAFTAAGGGPANHVARWTGTEWVGVGDGTDDVVKSLTLSTFNGATDDLVAGGDFTMAGGAPASRIARWDGTAWHAYGEGVFGGDVYALATTRDNLVVLGGDFAGAGGQPTPFVAAVRLVNPVSEAPAPQSRRITLSVGPNPTRGAATAFVTAETPATVEVFDALGRRVGRAEAPAGARVAVALPTERLAPGVYVVRLVADGLVQTARLVVAR